MMNDKKMNDMNQDQREPRARFKIKDVGLKTVLSKQLAVLLYAVT